MTLQLFLQLEKLAGSVLSEYGIIGIGFLALSYLAWHQYSRERSLAEEWRLDSKETNGKFVEISYKQAATQEKVSELLETLAVQQKEYHESVHSKISEVPRKVIKEIKYHELQEAQNRPNKNTPSP